MEKDDKIFRALACMGNASEAMSYANNWVEFVEEVPEELKEEMKKINYSIHEIQDKLREIRKSIPVVVHLR